MYLLLLEVCALSVLFISESVVHDVEVSAKSFKLKVDGVSNM